MYQVITRRFSHYKERDKGFADKPDLLLIDGGVVHAQTAEQALTELGLSFPVYGMVKDNRHRTRALVTSAGEEIGIQTVPSVFALIGQIQEETHRFAIEYHRQLRSKRLRESILDQIPGIGEVRKKQLLTTFKSVSAIERASLETLQKVLSDKQAERVYTFFHQKQGEETT